ncbi:uncharacterized protein At4g06744-like [Hordeum vulgare subsp. vulgare]|uniref:Uncharacterized protein n=1 Tax=Hordeum vulgare subsp. vulgare TaxID=112509 RepID=A0A8I6Z1X9_HORVV|nr:uncharacterized protein At4g06744-like [Hordeum vulgare subsp. vulgare]
MANHLKRPLVQQFFLLTSVAAIVAGPAEPHLSYKIHQHSSSYPQPRDFPSEQLYHAYFAIQRFKNTITSDPKNVTSTWTGHDICATTSYLGFNCGAPHGQASNLTVTSVIFDGFGLCSPMQQDLVDELPDLALFQASSNNFGGEVPILTGLSYMYMLDVHNKQGDQFEEAKSGTATTHLTQLCLGKNFCPGIRLRPILKPKHPRHGATSAKALLLNNNQLSESLPANLGLSKVSYLALANNKLTGPIPPSIAQAQDSLLEVVLLNNQLSGCLPNELGMLTKTTVIDAGMNQITGPIPSSFSCLGSVEQLNLAGNRLYGQVPDALCKLSWPAGRLANLTLSGNYFTSVGPACAALVKNGVLDVKHNCIPGFANQRGPAECASFLSQPKTCPSASARVACPAADAQSNAAAPGARVAKDYSSYVVYATLHE